VVDSSDGLIEFTGNIALNPDSFVAGTFSLKTGTAGNDSNTHPT